MLTVESWKEELQKTKKDVNSMKHLNTRERSSKEGSLQGYRGGKKKIVWKKKVVKNLRGECVLSPRESSVPSLE